MPWNLAGDKKFDRALGELENSLKIGGDASRMFNREHWSINAVVAITPLGLLAQEDLHHVFRNAWKALRFNHPTIAAYIADGNRYVYEIPDSVGLENWASETFRVVEGKTADDVIATTTTLSPYATMTYLPQTREILIHSQHWRTDGVGVMILMDEFLALAAQSSVDASSLPWGEETIRLSPSIEEAANIPENTSDEEKILGQQCAASFGNIVGAIGIDTHSYLDTQPGGTRTVQLDLTERETRAVVHTCKNLELSVTAAVHASVAAANYALANPKDANRKHYASTIRYSFRPFLPEPYSSRQYACTMFTTGWMFPVSADSSWIERARAYHAEYRKGLSPEFISAHREFANGLSNIFQRIPVGALSPTDVDFSSLGVTEKFLVRERRSPERGIRVDRISVGVEVVNRQCICYVWTFRDRLSLSLVYNEAYHDRERMGSFVRTVKDSLLHGLDIKGHP